MRHVLTAVVTAIEAMAVALVSLAVVVAPAILLGIVTLSLDVDFVHLAKSVAAVWGLGHSVPLDVSIDAVLALSYGLPPEPISFTISLTPLGLSLVTAALAVRLAARIGQTTGVSAAIVACATIGFAGSATAILWFAGELVGVPLPLGVLVASTWFAAPAWVTFLVKHRHTLAHGWFLIRVRIDAVVKLDIGWTLEQIIPRAVRLACAALLTVIALASIGVFFALALGYADIMSVNQALQLDLVGILILTLVQLALIPVLTIWSLAWLSGAGFSIGAGSSITPFETLVGPVPVLPVLGATPTAWNDWGLLAPIAVVLVTAILAFLFGRRPDLDKPALWKTLLVAVIAAVLAGCGAALLAAVGSGAIGPGRLAETGVDTWSFALSLAGETLVGLLLGLGLRRLLVRPISTMHSEGRTDEELVDLTEEIAPLLAAGTDGKAKSGPAERNEDDEETQVLDPLDSRIVDPAEEATRPWFHQATRKNKRPEPHQPEPVQPGLSEEELLRSYSWEANTGSHDPEEPSSESRVD